MANPKGKKHKAGGPPPKEKVVKKKSGCLIGFLLLILLIALLLFLMKHFKFGFFGDGEGDGGSSSGSTSVSDTVDDKNLTETVIDVTVLGNEYLYDNGKIELSSLISELKKMSGKISVHIKDDNAYQDIMQALIDELKKEGIPYMTPTGE